MNKGFTLVELLAVIVILSILGLVCIVGVTTIINRSKSDLSEAQEKAILTASKEWGSENIDKLPSAGNCIYLTLDNLKNYGLLDNNIVDPTTNDKVNDEMTIRIDAVNNSTYETVNYKYTISENVTNCEYIYGDFTLLEGESFNSKIKLLANNTETVTDTKIISIVFLKPGKLPEGVATAPHTDLSVNGDSSVLGYMLDGTVYIYSDGILEANAISDKMFFNLSRLEVIDFSGLSTKNVVSMTSMFSGCSNIKTLNLSRFDTGNVERMDSMFYGCSNLIDLDISSFDITKVTGSTGRYNNMFGLCEKINVTVNSSMKEFVRTRLVESDLTPNITVK